MLGFQRLDVYRCSIRLLSATYALGERLPRGHGPLMDQLRRAVLSIPLNIAEGSGKEGPDAARFFLIARGSAMETAAVLDVLETLGLVPASDVAEARELLDRVVAMLTRMAL